MKTINTNKLGTIGQFGEDEAVRLLVEKGYEILGRNVICNGNEIDIVARDMKYVVFVEVKTRTVFHGLSRFGSAASAVDNDKKAKIYAAAKSYLKENPQRRVPRYDVIEVYVDKNEQSIKLQRINHIPKAFGGGR